MVRNFAWALVFSVLGGSAALGQDWATKMFESTSYDFGTVARDAKTEYEFVLKNPYVEEVHIAGVSASCGCTTPIITKDTLKTYEKGAIIAHFNTDRFQGARSATLTVTIDRPFYAQVQLHVTGTIRTDVIVNPGNVDFGVMEQGTAGEKGIAVRYAGWQDWRITDIRGVSPYLTAKLVEVARGNGIVDYHVFVRVDPKAPPGYVNDHLILVTNDPAAPQVPVPVQGVIQAGIVVSPSSLFMGVVEPGKKVTKPLIVKGNKPFRIVSVTCEGKGFEFDTSGETTAKAVHVIPVTFMAGEEPGKITQSIRIQTDLGEKSPVLSAYAVVAK
jgi:hypothetical protein